MREIIRRIVVSAVSITATVVSISAQITASQAFVDAPQEIFPLLDKNTRLDMVDYFNNGMATQSSNKINGRSRITALTPQSLSVEMSAASDYQLALLPLGNDTLKAVITTVKTPAPDSRVDFFDSNWDRKPDGAYFVKPKMDDWLTDAGRKNAADVSAFVPFLLISYIYDPATGLLTLTNNTKDFLSADIYEIVGPYLEPYLTYKWNGKKFVKV